MKEIKEQSQEGERVEGNKAIAEFMGAKYDPFSHSWIGDVIPRKHQYEMVHHDALKYDTSWDWLMQVVEKIEKRSDIVVWTKIYGDTDIYEFSVYHSKTHSEERNAVVVLSSKVSKIDAVWHGIVLYLKQFPFNHPPPPREGDDK